jgi:hypothetical protein
MQKQVSAYRVNLKQGENKFDTVDEAEVFLRENDVALFYPLNNQFV